MGRPPADTRGLRVSSENGMCTPMDKGTCGAVDRTHPAADRYGQIAVCHPSGVTRSACRSPEGRGRESVICGTSIRVPRASDLVAPRRPRTFPVSARRLARRTRVVSRLL